MAQDSDDGQKTEDPTQRRLTRARSEGQVAQSREINTWFMLAASGIIMVYLAPSMARSIAHVLVAFTDPQRFIAGDDINWGAVAVSLHEVVLALAVPFLLLMLAAIAGTLIQTGFVFAVDRIGLNFTHLSLGNGLKRLFSPRSVLELGKSIAKTATVGAVTMSLLRGELVRLPLFSSMSVEDMLGETERLVLRLLLGILIALTVLAGIDYFYQRLHHLRSLRMSRRELKDEMKQSEGDPLIKARLRQIRNDRARRRMMTAVPGASVVIANPTHFAVALKYEMGAAGAPRVVAKGADLIALRIREIAEENDVPVVENPPLARALFAGVELDREIPREHYKAVAEIIGYVFRLKGKLPPRAAVV